MKIFLNNTNNTAIDNANTILPEYTIDDNIVFSLGVGDYIVINYIEYRIEKRISYFKNNFHIDYMIFEVKKLGAPSFLRLGGPGNR